LALFEVLAIFFGSSLDVDEDAGLEGVEEESAVVNYRKAAHNTRTRHQLPRLLLLIPRLRPRHVPSCLTRLYKAIDEGDLLFGEPVVELEDDDEVVAGGKRVDNLLKSIVAVMVIQVWRTQQPITDGK